MIHEKFYHHAKKVDLIARFKSFNRRRFQYVKMCQNSVIFKRR